MSLTKTNGHAEMVADMTRDELRAHEGVIERGIKTFVEVGSALLAIRDGRGYRFEYGTFEEYCQRRWGLKQSQAYRLMDAARVADNLKSSPMGELPATERQARPLTALDPDEQREAWTRAVETAPAGKLTAAHVQRVVDEIKRPHVSYNGGQNEWYTPLVYIEAARDVMGGIDLDPASSDIANKTVGAKHYYTKDDDGLSKTWRGRVWLNPPYSNELIVPFCEKLTECYHKGEVTQAIALVNNATETAWFGLLAEYAAAVVFPRGRVRFLDPDGHPRGAPLQGQACVYFGNDPQAFLARFAAFGWGATL